MFMKSEVSLWYCMVYLVVVYSCVVKSAKVDFGLFPGSDWYAEGYSFDGRGWTKAKPSSGILTTSVQRAGAEAWMITKQVKNVSNQIYMDIVAEPTACTAASCDLQIRAYNGNGKDLSIPQDDIDDRKRYLNEEFVILHNFTSTVNKKHSETFVVHTDPCMTLAIRANKADWTIYKLKMYYNYCEDTITNNIHLSRTNASVEVTANCLTNALSKDHHTGSIVRCLKNGTWGAISNECFCDRGFETRNSTGCLQCPENYYKSDISNSNCIKCPFKRVNNTYFTQCLCPANHYSGQAGSQCYGLPDKVTKIKIVNIDTTTVNVTWSEPVGDFYDILTFNVSCQYCDPPNSTVCNKTCTTEKYMPGQYNIPTTYVTISYLKPGFKYVFTIYSILNLAFSPRVPDGKWKSAEQLFILKEVPPSPKDANQVYIIIGAAGGALILIAIILIIFISISTRNKSTTTAKVI